MVTFLFLLCVALAACLSFLVWSFWPVLAQDWRDGQRRLNAGFKQDLLTYMREMWLRARVSPPAPLHGGAVVLQLHRR